MQRLISTLVFLVWGLWFGGLIALFIFVQTLFNTDRSIAVQAAPLMFLMFQKYHLVLAAIALAGTVVWRIAAPKKSVLVLFILLGLAACSGVAVAMWIIGPMEALRLNGQSGGPEFKRLHGQSMMLYVSQAALLLAGGITLACAMRSSSSAETSDLEGGISSLSIPST